MKSGIYTMSFDGRWCDRPPLTERVSMIIRRPALEVGCVPDTTAYATGNEARSWRRCYRAFLTTRRRGRSLLDTDRMINGPRRPPDNGTFAPAIAAAMSAS